MTGKIGKLTNRDQAYLDSAIDSALAEMWGEMPGEVVAFDTATQTATVQPLYRPKHNGTAVTMAQLQEVPVRFARAGGFVITTPVKAGDRVTLRPMMRSLESYHIDDDGTPSDARRFNPSDYEALDGGESLSTPIPNFNATNMEIRSADGQFAIEMSEDGKFKFRGAEGNAFSLVAEALRLLAGALTVVSSGSSAGTWPHNQQAPVLSIADKLDGMDIDA